MDSTSNQNYFQKLMDQFSLEVGNDIQVYLEALIIFLLGLAIAFLLKFLSYRLFRRVQNFLNKKIKSSLGVTQKLDSKGAQITSQIVFWGVFLFFIAVSLRVLNRPLISEGINKIAGYFPNVLAAVLIILFGLLVGNIISSTVQKFILSTNRSNGELYGKFFKLIVIFTASLLAIEQLGFNINLLIMILGIMTGMFAGGLAIAFALGAKDSVKNAIAFHYVEKNFQIGQKISVNEIEGKIVGMSAGQLTLENARGKIFIPSGWFQDHPVHIIQDEQLP